MLVVIIVDEILYQKAKNLQFNRKKQIAKKYFKIMS